MASAPTSAKIITRKAKSNLAFALASLPENRRDDMIRFYAFCRVVDDIADDESVPLEQRERLLARWRAAVAGPVADEDPLAGEIRALATKYAVPTDRFDEIIHGMMMDLQAQRFATATDLEAYCHLVASVVGLVSIEIFGYQDPGCRDYALALGQALQWTNIMRDVAEDARAGRVYLPIDDLARFQLTEADILAGVEDDRFLALMEFEYARTEGYYRKAMEYLPPRDRKAMVAAETMRRIYHALLLKMRADGFRVFSKRYRLGKPHMVWLLLATRLGWKRPRHDNAAKHGPSGGIS